MYPVAIRVLSSPDMTERSNLTRRVKLNIKLLTIENTEDVISNNWGNETHSGFSALFQRIPLCFNVGKVIQRLLSFDTWNSLKEMCSQLEFATILGSNLPNTKFAFNMKSRIVLFCMRKIQITEELCNVGCLLTNNWNCQRQFSNDCKRLCKGK